MCKSLKMPMQRKEKEDRQKGRECELRRETGGQEREWGWRQEREARAEARAADKGRRRTAGEILAGGDRRMGPP